ncbi:hypothetical protein M5E87_07720 [Flavonifractor plautii]|nr:hypothetical protein M5E87_07720 [Flavonifractor plautii]
MDAIKRRCDAGMGRCQGGFCGPGCMRSWPVSWVFPNGYNNG